MRALYVPLQSDVLDKLTQLAQQERRRPQDQAAVLLERALVARPPQEPRASERAGREADDGRR